MIPGCGARRLMLPRNPHDRAVRSRGLYTIAQAPARRLAVPGPLLVQVACLLLFFDGMGTILLVIVVLMLLGAIPTWPHSRSWGYAPSGGIGLVLLILVILLLSGRL